MTRAVVAASVVIPTIGRPEMLRGCLDSIVACDPPADEIVVVDQSGDPAVRALVEELGDGRTRLVQCEGRGVATAMNVGLREAVHDFVITTHDDCTVARDWIGVANRLANHDPGGILTGRVLPPQGSGYVPSTNSSTQSRDFTGTAISGALFPNNMALSRSAVVEIGGFDERPTLRFAEDNDLCYRWLTAGRSLRYEPELVVWHHDWRDPASVVRTHTEYARSQGALYGKYLYAHDWRMLSMLTRDLRAGVRSIVSALLKQRQRWTDARREVLPYLLIGLVKGLVEANQLARADEALDREVEAAKSTGQSSSTDH